MRRKKTTFEIDIASKVDEIGAKEAVRRLAEALRQSELEDDRTFVGEDGVRYSCNRTDCYCEGLKPGENCRNWKAIEQLTADAKTSEGAATPAGERAPHEPALSLADRGSEESAVLSGRASTLDPEKWVDLFLTEMGSPVASDMNTLKSAGMRAWLAHAYREGTRCRAAATPPRCERFHAHPAEWDALVELARVAQRYHDETGHGSPCAAAQCDPICEALQAWRKAANPDG